LTNSLNSRTFTPVMSLKKNQILYTIFLCCCNITITIGCCSAEKYNIYPLGYIKDTLIVAECSMIRTCEKGNGASPTSEYHWTATVNLSYIKADTAVFIQNIDSLSFKDCTCNFKNYNKKSRLAKHLLPSYQMAIREAKQLKGFTEVTPTSYQFISKNDTIPEFRFKNTDTSSTFYFKGKVKNLTPKNWDSCGFLNNIQEIRKYKLGTKQVLVINLNCSDLGSESHKMILENYEKFKSINTSITNTPNRWHGLSRDYIIEY
jgi:hypothetical protein